MKKFLKAIGLSLVIGGAGLPAAFVLTVLMAPFWRWLETAAGVESYGHSGPAEWCYWLVYALVLLISGLLWWCVKRTR